MPRARLVNPRMRDLAVHPDLDPDELQRLKDLGRALFRRLLAKVFAKC